MAEWRGRRASAARLRKISTSVGVDGKLLRKRVEEEYEVEDGNPAGFGEHVVIL